MELEMSESYLSQVIFSRASFLKHFGVLMQEPNLIQAEQNLLNVRARGRKKEGGKYNSMLSFPGIIHVKPERNNAF